MSAIRLFRPEARAAVPRRSPESSRSMTCAAPFTLIPTVSFVRVTFVVIFFGVCHRVSRFSKLIPTGDRPLSLEEIQVHPYFNLHKIQRAPVAFYLGRWHNFEFPTLIVSTKDDARTIWSCQPSPFSVHVPPSCVVTWCEWNLLVLAPPI